MTIKQLEEEKIYCEKKIKYYESWWDHPRRDQDVASLSDLSGDAVIWGQKLKEINLQIKRVQFTLSI